ncbi:MAG: archaetidylserine synthase [Methanolobus sp.]|jgi:CDP-diacylglycerol--serine O-phosphatidyltransferase|nr:archaetidylserine synthase [Methanolobus sp.]MDK2833696.1 archaetidylserine synthase [Methanolobus sp.]MDK2912204.1 archaetidylserine synthase [Methanolobus sp.]
MIILISFTEKMAGHHKYNSYSPTKMEVNTIIQTLKIADLVTLLNSLLGLLAVVLVQNGFTYLAPVLILAAAVADGADGYLSRLFSGSEIGANLDSLADVISFGLAPVALVYAAAGAEASYLLLGALCFYFFCGILRLARFNTAHQGLPSFKGLPITAGGIILSAYVLAGERYFHSGLMILLSLVIGLLMISKVTYMKARKPAHVGPVGLLFIITVLSYPVNTEYTHALASLLLAVMLIYVISPVFRRNGERKVDA